MSTSATVGTLKVILTAEASEFKAAMASATADVQKIGAALQKDLEPRQRAVNAAVRDFLGTDEIRKAQEYTAAIQKIGGVSTLTEANQRKVNKAVSDAIDQYKALGQKAPADMQAVYDATKKAGSGTDIFSGALSKLAGGLAIGGLATAAVGGLVSIGKGAFDAAGHLADMSQKTGLSLKALQQFGFIAEQNGATVDDFADAIFKMGVKIEEGGPKVEHAFREINTSYEEMSKLKPEEQFDKIMRALAAIQDPAERNRIGVELMGKAYATVAGSVEDYIAQMGRAPVASDAAIKATDAAGDAISRAWSKAKSVAIDAIGGILLAVEHGVSEAGRYQGANMAFGARPALGQATGGPAAAPGPVAAAAAVVPSPKAVQDYVASLKEAQKAIDALGPSVRAQIDAALKQGVTMQEVAKQFHLSGEMQQIYAGYVKPLADESKKADDAAKNYNSSIKDLTETQIANIAAALAQGKSQGDIAKVLHVTAQQVSDVQKAQEEATKVSLYLQQQEIEKRKELQKVWEAQYTVASTIAKGVADEFIKNQKAIDAIMANQVKNAQAKAKDIAATFIQTVNLQKEAQDLFDQRTMTSLAYQKLQIQNWADNTKKAFKGTEDQVRAFYAAVDAVTHEKLAALGSAWVDELAKVSNALGGLGSAATGGMRRVMDAVGQGVQVMLQLGKVIDDTKNKSLSMGQAVASGLSVISATNTVFNIIDSLSDPAWMTPMREIGKRWGVQISQGLAQQLSDPGSAGDIVRAVDNTPGLGFSLNADQLATRQQVVDLLNIDKVMKDIGIDGKNINDWIERAAPLTAVIANGGEAGAVATKTLVSVLDQLSQQASIAGGVWGESFKAMISQAKELGVGLDQINSMLDGQLSKISAATGKATGGLTGLLSKPGKTLDTLTTQQKDQTDRGDLSGAEETAKQIKDLTTKTVSELQPEFDRLNRITLASFNAYIANGHTAVEAIQAVGPAFDQLKAAADKFGFAGSDAFNQLSRWRDLTTQNAPLLDQVSGLNDLMVSLSNVGALDASTFADLQAQGVATFQQLTAAGFTQQEALTQMAPMLQTIKDLHDQNGLAIDDATQKLLDQAEAQGVVKDKEETTQSVLKDGFSALLTALGVDLPAAWKTFAKAGKDAAGDVSKALTDIKQPEINWPAPPDYSGWDPTGSSPGTGSGTPPGYPGTEPPPFAVGGVINPTPGGKLIRVAEAGYPETVLPGDWSDLLNATRQMPNYDGAMAGVYAGGGGPSGVAPQAGPISFAVSAGDVHIDGKKAGRILWKPMVEDLQRRQLTR